MSDSKEDNCELGGLVKSLYRVLVVAVLLIAFWLTWYSVGEQIPVITKLDFGQFGRIGTFPIPMWLNIVSVPLIVFCLFETFRVLEKSTKDWDDVLLTAGTLTIPLLSFPIVGVMSNLAFPLPVAVLMLLVARVISPYALLLLGLMVTLLSSIGPIVGVITLLIFLTCPKIWREIIAKFRTMELLKLEPSRRPFLLPKKRVWWV